MPSLADLTFKMHGQVGILWRTLSKTVLTRVYKSTKFYLRRFFTPVLSESMNNKTTPSIFIFIFYQSGLAQGNKKVFGGSLL
jgi:hypothetical protein